MAVTVLLSLTKANVIPLAGICSLSHFLQGVGINISGIFDVCTWQPTHPIYNLCLLQSLLWEAVKWSSGKTYALKMSYGSASASEVRARQKNIPKTFIFKSRRLTKEKDVTCVNRHE